MSGSCLTHKIFLFMDLDTDRSPCSWQPSHCPDIGRSVENDQFLWAGCCGKGLQRQGLPTCWLLHFKHAPGCVCERTGQAGTEEQLCQYWQNGKNKHFSSRCHFRSFPLVNLPWACKLCVQICFPANTTVLFPQQVQCFQLCM